MSEPWLRTTTRPIPPKPERRSVPLWPVALLSIATGWLLATTVAEWRVPQTPQAVSAPVVATQPPPTVVVNAVLTLPTPTITPVPTAQPTAKPTADASRNWCSNREPKPGTACQGDPAPTPTEAPRPTCPAGPGVWCVWTSDPATGPEMEVGE